MMSIKSANKTSMQS